jgi:hypothetical protein
MSEESTGRFAINISRRKFLSLVRIGLTTMTITTLAWTEAPSAAGQSSPDDDRDNPNRPPEDTSSNQDGGQKTGDTPPPTFLGSPIPTFLGTPIPTKTLEP